MDRRHTISYQADQDLLEIGFYTALKNMVAANRFVQRLEETFNRLATNPRMGRIRDDLAPNLRSFPVGSYLIFYRQTEEGIEVIRVLHGARDIDSLFHKDEE